MTGEGALLRMMGEGVLLRMTGEGALLRMTTVGGGTLQNDGEGSVILNAPFVIPNAPLSFRTE